MDRGGDPGPLRLRLSAGAGAGGGPALPPHPAVLPAPVPLLSALLRGLSAPCGCRSLPHRTGGQPADSEVSCGADLPGHLQRGRSVEPVHPVPGERAGRPDRAPPPGRHVGPGLRLSGGPVRLFPPPQRLEAAAAGRGGGGDPAAGAGRRRPVSRGDPPPAAQAFQPAELLSDPGGAGHLLSHVRHRPGGRGHPRVHRARWPERTGAALPRSVSRPSARQVGRRGRCIQRMSVISAGNPAPGPPWPPDR